MGRIETGTSSAPRVPYYEEDPAEAARIGAELTKVGGSPGGRILIAGATILTMDPAVPDLPTGDIIVEGSEIVAVSATSLAEQAADAVVVNGVGMIAIPGMCDSHRHCWQTQFRRIIADVPDLDSYVKAAHRTLAFAYRPDDMYIGNLLAVVGAIDGGVTSVLDLSHNSRSREHRDAAVQGLFDSGGRCVHASHGALFGDWDELWPADVERLREEFFADDGQLVTLRLGCHGSDAAAARESTAGIPISLSPEKIEFARDLDIGISVDGVLGPDAAANIEHLGELGLLGPDITLIHMTGMTERSWRFAADGGAQISLTPTSDAHIGSDDAMPPIQACIDHGIAPSLSVDTEVSLSTDMFSQMRFILNLQRMGVFYRRFHEGAEGLELIDTRDVLEYATIQGARANGLGDRVGSLTPGKEADIVLIRAEDVNNLPLMSATGTVVNGADNSNIDTVLIGGRPRKWRGELVGYDMRRIRRLALESSDRIISETGIEVDVLGRHRQ